LQRGEGPGGGWGCPSRRKGGPQETVIGLVKQKLKKKIWGKRKLPNSTKTGGGER